MLFLGLLGTAARFRPVSVRAPGGDGTKVYYPPGDSFFIAVLLQDRPAAALAVSLIATLLTLSSQPNICLKRPFSFKCYLERIEARREAESDPLTGLASWRGLENFLKRRMAACTPIRRRGEREDQRARVHRARYR